VQNRDFAAWTGVYLLNESAEGGHSLASKTIRAAGGIVVRKGARPLIAIVQRSKDDRWVLPRGKLKRTERAIDGARREVVEETGHRVRVREYLGAVTYRAQGRPKVVLFWRMQARARPSHELMKDIAAVEWLPLSKAVRRLSYPLEKLFLDNVGATAIGRRKRASHRKRTARSKRGKSSATKSRRGKSKNAKFKSIRPKKSKSKSKSKAKAKRRPHTVVKAPVHKAPAAHIVHHSAVRHDVIQHNVIQHRAPPHAERRTVLQRVLETLGR
jgi:8-oxo-dGTP diphosphatase